VDPDPIAVLDRDDGIVVDEDELDAFMDDEDEDARAAKQAAERRARRKAIERKHAAAAEPAPTVVQAAQAATRDQAAAAQVHQQSTEDAEARDKAVKYEVTPLGLTEIKPEDGAFDMFGEQAVDIDAPRSQAVGKRATAAQLLAGELGEHEQTNWDDVDGYYMARPGETIDGRYRVLGVVGRGVFSSVLKARDEVAEKANDNDAPAYVAVKMIRNNETMTKAAAKEIELLREIARGDPHGKTHCVRLLCATEHRAHTALVFESMAMNLREALKKYGKHVGINIGAVRIYAKQLLFALRHLAKLHIVHADVKPDNILVSENNAVLRLCDFGSAFRASDPGCDDPAPYLVSRFYRAPEIILGLKYDARVDLWAVGTCLYELYTGHIMYPGADNNNMLRLMMELKGRFPVRMLRAHVRVYSELLLLDPHFLDVQSSFKFQHRVLDERTKEPRLTLVSVDKPTRSIAQTFLSKKAGADNKRTVLDLADFLEQVCMLNPDNRPGVAECLKHRFVAGRQKHPRDKKPEAAASGSVRSRSPGRL